MIENKFSFLEIGNAKYTGFSEKAVDFIASVQLKDKTLWDKCVGVFGTGIDVKDHGWRGEFFGKTAFVKGPIVLCRDEEKEQRKIDFAKKENLEKTDKGYIFRTAEKQGDETCRYVVNTNDGDKIVLTDYATCGKNWTGELPNISVWLNVK